MRRRLKFVCACTCVWSHLTTGVSVKVCPEIPTKAIQFEAIKVSQPEDQVKSNLVYGR